MNTDENINNEFQTNFTSELHTLESQNVQLDTTDSELNKEINTDEIMKAIKSFKNDKSASGDDITNKMLKHGTPVLINAIKKLFNYIFNIGKFPCSWNESFIVLIHKKGSKLQRNFLNIMSWETLYQSH